MSRKVMPRQKPGRSKQDYRTPVALLEAVRSYLGIGNFWIDLAATYANRVRPLYYGPKHDALKQSWLRSEVSPAITNTDSDWAWCNPPYADIGPWVRKAYEESQRGARIAMLIPASVGSNYWRDWVHEKAHVLLLNGRITFVGAEQGYPKDCVILLFRPTIGISGYSVWRWTEQVESPAKEPL